MTLSECFEEFTIEAVRLETLPIYNVEEEKLDYQSFLVGEFDASIIADGYWPQFLKDSEKLGRRIIRYRLVPHPETDYFQFEKLFYAYNIASGEEINFLDALPTQAQDFWLFDRSIVAVMNYDFNGAYLGCNITTDAEKVRECNEVIDTLRESLG